MIKKYFKNTDTVTRTWLGKQLAVNEYWELPESYWEQANKDVTVAADIASGDLTIAKDDTGSTDLGVAAAQIWITAIDPRCLETEFFDLLNTSNPPHQEGRFFYDHAEHAYAMYNDNSNVTHQLGQEFLIRVYNDSGAQLDDGKPVYVSGTEGVENRPTVALAKADAVATSKVIGVVTADIPDASFGWITFVGLVNGIDTSAFSSGDDLYLDESTAGEYRTTVPGAGNEVVHIGYCIRSHATEGRLLIAVGDHQHHPGLTDNPHAVTKTQVGLSNVPNTDATQRANHTGTQTASTISDFDTEVSNNTSVVANTAKVTNATHTGEVTGSTSLTLDKTAISNQGLVTAALTDHVLVGDASDSDNLKKVTVQTITDLATPIFGSEFQSVNSTGRSTTTSSGWSQKLQMTTPSLPSGTYYITWSATIGIQGSNKEYGARFREDNSVTHQEIDNKIEGGDTGESALAFSGHVVRSLSGVTIFDIDYGRTNSTAFAEDAYITIWRIS